MKILVLGATGRTGEIVVQLALQKGHEVTCLARKTARIKKRKRLTIIDGNPTNEIDLKKAVDQCDCVVSVLNISRKSDFPWASLRTPKTFLSDTMRLLVRVSDNKKVKQIAVCSAWGVAETLHDIPKWFRWFIDNSKIGVAYKDHQRQEQILEESKLTWTIVRPVGLSNSKKAEKIKETFSNQPKPSLLISRQSLARYLVESLENEALIKQKVVISKQ